MLSVALGDTDAVSQLVALIDTLPDFISDRVPGELPQALTDAVSELLPQGDADEERHGASDPLLPLDAATLAEGDANDVRDVHAMHCSAMKPGRPFAAGAPPAKMAPG